MASYRPVAGTHAIEQAVVGIRISGTTSDEVYAAAVSKAAELATNAGLPGRVQLDPLSLFFGRQVISAGYAATDMKPGTVFQRVDPAGSMAEELTVERNAITFRTHTYRRWADMVVHIKGMLCPVAEILAGGDVARLAVVELRCVDRFVSDSDETPPLSELIRSDSPYITPELAARNSLLHLHSGWIDEEGEAGRTLFNLNVEVGLSDEGKPSALILQVVSKQASGIGAYFDSDAGFEATVSNAFQELHAADKALLAKLLVEQAQSAIDLKGSSGLGDA